MGMTTIDVMKKDISIRTSKIAEVIISRLRALKLLKEETKSINHASSIGLIRERRLGKLLKNYLPKDIDIETGFICDCVGRISPQIDLIIVDRDPIPTIDFDDEFKLIPVEKVICCIEVKSTLTTDALQQLKDQEEAINSMPRCLGAPSERGESMPPVMFVGFALDSNVNEPTLEDFLKNNRYIRQITVVEKSSFRNKKWDGIDIQKCPDDEDYFATRTSLAWLLPAPPRHGESPRCRRRRRLRVRSG